MWEANPPLREKLLRFRVAAARVAYFTISLFSYVFLHTLLYYTIA